MIRSRAFGPPGAGVWGGVMLVVALGGCALPTPAEDARAPEAAVAGLPETSRWIRSGLRARRAGDFDAAERAYGRALEADPDSAAAREGLGLVHLSRGNHAMAEIALERALALDPNRPESLAAMGALLDALERHAEARERYARAMEVGGRTPSLLNDLGYSRYLAGDPAAAEAFEEALDLDPGFDRARANLALARFRTGDEEGALRAFAHIVGEYRALNNVGYLYLVAGDDASARRLLARSRDAAPRGYRRAERNFERVGDPRLRAALGLDALRAGLALAERSGRRGARTAGSVEPPDPRDGAGVTGRSALGGPLVPYDAENAVEVAGADREAPEVPTGVSKADTEPVDPNGHEPIVEPALELVRAVQRALNERGMDAGEVDGAPGARTVRALRQFKIARRLPVTDDITPRLLDELGLTRP